MGQGDLDKIAPTGRDGVREISNALVGEFSDAHSVGESFPKGNHPAAQGCEERATLGIVFKNREPQSGFHPMPQSLSSVYLHIVFSTKERFPFLSDPKVREEVHAFLGGVARNRRCPPLVVGGVADYVHALIQLGRTVSQADLVKELKRSSSLWIHERFPQFNAFAWQAGYGAFSVSVSSLDSVRTYIAKQEEHHAKISFQDEFRQFLEKHGLDYDERFVWD